MKNNKKLLKKDYYNYIRSDKWKEKKEKFFSSKLRYKNNCYVCGKNKASVDLELHHRTYKNLGNEKIVCDLVPVCRDCHEGIHKFQKEKEFGIWGATKYYRRLIQKQLEPQKIKNALFKIKFTDFYVRDKIPLKTVQKHYEIVTNPKSSKKKCRNIAKMYVKYNKDMILSRTILMNYLKKRLEKEEYVRT